MDALMMPPRIPSEAASLIPVLLIMHTAVDYLPKHGVGIAVVQQACDPDTPGETLSHEIIEPRESTFSIYSGSMAQENVETPERAEMRAIVHALEIARSTFTQTFQLGSSCFVKRLVISGASPGMAAFINHHIALGRQSLQGMQTDDRIWLTSIMRTVKYFSHRDVSVSIDVAAMVGTTVAAKEAVMLSRGRGRISCMARLRHQRKMNKARKLEKTRFATITGDGRIKVVDNARNSASLGNGKTKATDG